MQTEFINWLEGKGLSQRSIKEYQRYYIRLYRKGHFTQKNVDRFIRECPNNVGRAFLKNYKAFLLRNPKAIGLDKEDVATITSLDIPGLKKKKRKIPKTITEEELNRIESFMESEGTKIMLHLSYFCGLRKQELLTIKISDFNWDEWNKDNKEYGLLTVMGKGDVENVIPVTPKLMRRIILWMNEPEVLETIKKTKYLFAVHYSFWRRVLAKKSIEAIGWRVKPHTLRHSIAVALVKKGWGIHLIQNFLRHENISTTELYARVDKSQIINMYKKTYG